MSTTEELRRLLNNRRDAERDLVPRRVISRNIDGTENVVRLDGECPERWTGNDGVGQVTLMPGASPFGDRGLTGVTSQSSGLGLVWLESQTPRLLERGRTQTVTIHGRGLAPSLAVSYLLADLTPHPDVVVGQVTFIGSETLELEVTVSAGAQVVSGAPVSYGYGGRSLHRADFYDCGGSVITRFIAVERKSTSELAIARYDGMTFFEIAQASVAVAADSVTYSLAGRMQLITGDGDLPNGSLAFFSAASIIDPDGGYESLDPRGPWTLHTVDVDSGAVRSDTLTPRAGFDFMKVVSGIDYYQGKLRFLVWHRRDSTGEGDPGDAVLEVWAADSLLSAVTLIQTVDLPNGSDHVACWARLGDDAQVLRTDSHLQLRGIDTVGLTAAGVSFGSGRTLPFPSATNVLNGYGVSSDSSPTYFVMSRDQFSPRHLMLVRVGSAGNGVDTGWPVGWVYGSGPVSFKRRATTGEGMYLSHVRDLGTGYTLIGLLEGTTDGVFDTSSPAPIQVPEEPAGFRPDYLLPI